jgi:hypothetical protein
MARLAEARRRRKRRDDEDLKVAREQARPRADRRSRNPTNGAHNPFSSAARSRNDYDRDAMVHDHEQPGGWQ